MVSASAATSSATPIAKDLKFSRAKSLGYLHEYSIMVYPTNCPTVQDRRDEPRDGAFPTVTDSKYCPGRSLSACSLLPSASADDTYSGWIGSGTENIANSLAGVRSTTLKVSAVESIGT